MLGGVIFMIHIMQRGKIFQMSVWGREKERERELRLNRLDGDNFHDRDWEEVIPLSGANTKFSLWHSQTHNICFHLALCVCEEEKMKERGRERVIV